MCLHPFLQVGNSVNHGNTDLNIMDFSHIEKAAFPPKGCNEAPFITPPHDLAHTFKFKSYAPKIFHRLREFYDIDAPAYMNSVCGKDIVGINSDEII